jgi:hypothetical protein
LQALIDQRILPFSLGRQQQEESTVQHPELKIELPGAALTVSGSTESGGPTQAMVLRRHRGHRRREEDGGDQWRTPARLGGRRRTEHLGHDATLDISLVTLRNETLCWSKPVGEYDDDVGGRRRAAPPDIVRRTGVGHSGLFG